MCGSRPSAPPPPPPPEFTGDRFEVVGFEADDSLSDANYTVTQFTPTPGAFNLPGRPPHGRTTSFVNRPSGLHGQSEFTFRPKPVSMFGNNNPFGGPRTPANNIFGGRQQYTPPAPQGTYIRNGTSKLYPSATKSGVTKREDGSYIGATTSRINPETGKREYGHYIFGGSNKGEYGIFEGKIGKPKDFGYKPINKSKVSDTRHLKSVARLTVGKKSNKLKSSGGINRAKTAGLVVGKEKAAVASGINVPKG